MRYTLIVTFRGSMATDPALHALACVHGPAQVAGPEALRDEPADAAGVVFYVTDIADAPAVVLAVQLHRLWLSERWFELITRGSHQDPAPWIDMSMQVVAMILTRLSMRSLPDDPQQALELIFLSAHSGGRSHLSGPQMDRDQLKPYVEGFLTGHNTCSLATCNRGMVSCRPVEYHYAGGHLYMVSEGGEKFAGLLGNRVASISIYEPYEGFDKLASMQLTGAASVPLPGSEEYERILQSCGLQPGQIALLPYLMHAIDMHLFHGTYLWSGFRAMGLDVRQYYDWRMPFGGVPRNPGFRSTPPGRPPLPGGNGYDSRN